MPDNSSPSNCKIALAFSIAAEHRSASLFACYRKRRLDLKVAIPLNCGVPAFTNKDKLNSIKSKRVSVASYNEDTCTQCRALIISAISAKEIRNESGFRHLPRRKIGRPTTSLGYCSN